MANRLRRRTSDQTVLGSNPVVAAALSPWTRLFTPIVPRRSLHSSFYISYLAILVKYMLAQKKCCSNILNVTICKESGHAQHDFEPLEEGHWIFSGYKVKVMFILSESCSPRLCKTEIFSWSACKLLSWREKLVDYCTRRAQLQMKALWWDAHYLRVHFYRL